MTRSLLAITLAAGLLAACSGSPAAPAKATTPAGSAKKTTKPVEGGDPLKPWTDAKKVFVLGGHQKLTGAIYTSTDGGVTWKQTFTGKAADPVTRVTFADGKFVALLRRSIVTSADGTTWSEPMKLPFTADANAVAFGGGMWLAVSKGQVAYSKDGATWSALDMLDPETNFNLLKAPAGSTDLEDVAFGGGKFVATGNFRWAVTFTVKDDKPVLGTITRNSETATEKATGIVYDGKKWVLVGTDWAGTSTDGKAAKDAKGFAGSALGLTFANQRFVAPALKGAIVTSTDGTTWTATTPDSDKETYNQAAWGNGRWLVCSETGKLAVSGDGKDWKAVDPKVANKDYDLTARGAAFGAL